MKKDCPHGQTSRKHCKKCCHADAERIRRAGIPKGLRNSQERQYYRENREWRVRSRKQRRHDPNKGMSDKFNELKTSASQRGWEFTLTKEDFLSLYKAETCPVDGVLFEPSGTDRNLWPSIDRIIPDVGYTKENTVKICYGCNRRKNDATVEQHRRIADWMESEIRVRNLSQ